MFNSKLLPTNYLKKQWLLLLMVTQFFAFLPATSFAMSQTIRPPVESDYSEISAQANQIPFMSASDYSASQKTYQHTGQHFSIWQGMKHEWKRFIIDNTNGRIPHRISTYENFLVPGLDSYQLTSRMGQNTGVDGNYMYPSSRAIAINSSDLNIAEGSITFNWQDQINESEVPVARSRIEYDLQLPDQPWSEGHSSVFLQGLSIKTNCDRTDTDNLCNSDGMWPYLYHISIEQCQASQTSGTQCTVAINISRAWTPNKGGFQLINEVKPLNKKLQYELTVFYAGLSGEKEHIAAQDKRIISQENTLQEGRISAQTFSLSSDQSHLQYEDGVAVITAFGFILNQPERIDLSWALLGSDVRQRGRYIARQQFEVVNSEYNSATGTLSSDVNLSVWAPKTVVNSDYIAEMNVQLIELGNANKVVDRKHLTGIICLNSKDEAPFFSKWNKCDRQGAAAIKKYGGSEQESVEVLALIGVDD